MLSGRPMMIQTEFLESGSLDHFLKVRDLYLVFSVLGYASFAMDKNNEVVPGEGLIIFSCKEQQQQQPKTTTQT